jgi:hypothetical protein
MSDNEIGSDCEMNGEGGYQKEDALDFAIEVM